MHTNTTIGLQSTEQHDAENIMSRFRSVFSFHREEDSIRKAHLNVSEVTGTFEPVEPRARFAVGVDCVQVSTYRRTGIL